MKYLCWLALVLSSFPAMAQKALFSHWDTPGEGQSFAGIQASGGVASGQFANTFMSSLLFDDVLDDAKTSDQLARLKKTRNIAGGDYELSVVGKLNIKHTSHSLLIKLSDAGHADVRLSRAAFDLAFYGNRAHAGDTVQLSSMQLGFWRYQQAGIGWAYAPNAGMQVYALLSYVNGEQLLQADLDRAWLYTSALGDTVSAEVKGHYVQSDSAHQGFMQPNGAGASIDLGFRYTFEGTGSSWILNAEVRNLGMVQWKPASLHFDADSAIEFRGIAIDDIRTVDDQFRNGQLRDSLIGGVEDDFHKGTDNRLMPGWLQAELMQYKTRGVELGFGFTARWKANYNTFGWFDFGYRFQPHIAVHGELGYGGYGAFQCAVQASFDYQRFSVFARVGNLEAFVLPSRFAGGSGMLAARYYF